jgi:hypothetical protein
MQHQGGQTTEKQICHARWAEDRANGRAAARRIVPELPRAISRAEKLGQGLINHGL